MNDATTLTATPEPLTPALDEFLAIFQGHQPIEAREHAPEPAVFTEMDALGLLVFVALRDAEGMLRGCTLSSAYDSHFAKRREGTTDVLITPGGEEDGEVIATLVEATEAALTARGVRHWTVPPHIEAKIRTSSKDHGFQPIEPSPPVGVA